MNIGDEYVFPMECISHGLTKRELFAAMAMHAYITATGSNELVPSPKFAAERAAQYADALIAELDKPR